MTKKLFNLIIDTSGFIEELEVEIYEWEEVLIEGMIYQMNKNSDDENIIYQEKLIQQEENISRRSKKIRGDYGILD